MLEFRLLGPVGVWADGRRVALGPAEVAKARCVLAVLLSRPGSLVGTDALVERVWGETPPGPAVRYKYVGWLRSALAPYAVALRHREDGYLLPVEPEQVDLHRFRELVAHAQRAVGADPSGAAELLEQGLRLWRGTALAGLTGSWAEMFRDQLAREQRDARVLWARCALDVGGGGPVLDRLAEWETEYPVDEEVTALRMGALYRAGQRAQALACYDRADRRLWDALESSPGPALRTMRRRIADHEVVLAEPAPPGPPRPRAVPRQLPSFTPHFTGRSREVALLDALLDDAALPAGAVVISAIGGTAGIGKTALALFWAHRVAQRFPDGQLFVNLRGFDPGGRPVTAEEAVRQFLGALDVEPERVPADPAAQAALYRSLLAGRRVLVLLDNARSAEQVRPLLPGSSTCLVVVTSRDLLTGLVAADGAHPLTLDLLTAGEARELLSRRLGAVRVAEDAAAVAQLVALCARLPLALNIAAARAASRPARALTVLVADLRDARRRLDALRGGDPASDLRAVFSWSYRTLSEPAARLFRLLGLHPGPDITLPAAASLAGTTRSAAGDAIEELIEAHLLTEHVAGRFAFHDLLRAYAGEGSRAHDSGDERYGAMRRVLDHYLHTAHAAALLLHPPREPIALDASRLDISPEEFDGQAGALAWFEAEHAVLYAVITHAADCGFDTHAWQIPVTIADYAGRRGNWPGWEAAQRTALAATRRLGDPREQARVHCGLGFALMRSGRPGDAEAHLRQARTLYGELGDLTGRSHVSSGLAWLCGREGREREALEHALEARELFERLGHLPGVARASNTVGRYHALLGDHTAALAACERAVAVHRELGDRHGQAASWDQLGWIEQQFGHPDRARRCYRWAADLYRESGDRCFEARTLLHLGHAHDRTGEPDAARGVWQHALALLDESTDARTETVRAQLRALVDR